MRLDDVKTGADPSSWILGEALRLPKRHPACRRREAQSGSCTERENLPRCRGKAQAAPTARPKVPMRRRGADCLVVVLSGVMPVERRGWVIALRSANRQRRNLIFNGRRQPSCGGTSRMTRECQVRICERLGVKFPGLLGINGPKCIVRIESATNCGLCIPLRICRQPQRSAPLRATMRRASDEQRALGQPPPVAWVKTPVLLGQMPQVENDLRQRVWEGARSAGVPTGDKRLVCAREIPAPGRRARPSAVP
jgi:hypothetical protein